MVQQHTAGPSTQNFHKRSSCINLVGFNFQPNSEKISILASKLYVLNIFYTCR